MLVPALQMRRAVAQACAGWQPDVVHCGHVHAGLLALELKRQLAVPYVLYGYGRELTPVHLNPRRFWHRQFGRRILQGADRILVISDFTRHLVLAWPVPVERVRKIPMGVDVVRYGEDLPWPEDLRSLKRAGKRIVLSVGRLVPHKGFDVLIRAMPQVLARVPETVCVIVGDGPQREALRALAHAEGVADRVHFTGRVPDTRPYYAACDVFAMPNRSVAETGDVEGFGIAFLEASAAGKPVIGGRAGGTADAVRDGETGLLMDPTDLNVVAGAVIHLLTDGEFAARLGRAGREWVRRERTWEATVAAVMSYLPGE